MAPTEAAVEGVDRLYDDHYAIVGLDAVFPAGQITALLGPNGAGKSTLMSLLSTLARPTEGDLRLGRHQYRRSAAAIRGLIGYVGHKTMLYRELTARENLAFFARMHGLPRDRDRDGAWLERVGLARDADRSVSGFSRGMAQRLTLARALLPSPALVLLDEPLTGLDQSGVDFALDLFRECAERGAIVVMASHDLAAMGRIADRMLLLRRGRKVYEGPVEGDLATQYRARLEAIR